MYTKKDTGYYVNRHSCFLLTYHVALVTKYRKPVLHGKVKELVYGIIRDIWKRGDINFLLLLSLQLHLTGCSGHSHLRWLLLHFSVSFPCLSYTLL